MQAKNLPDLGKQFRIKRIRAECGIIGGMKVMVIACVLMFDDDGRLWASSFCRRHGHLVGGADGDGVGVRALW